MKSILQTYLEQEIWLLIRDKWYFATVVRVGDDLLWFKHRTYDRDLESDTLWEMVVRINEVVAIDKAKSIVSRKPDVLLSQIIETDKV